MLGNNGVRWRHGEPISTAFVENAAKEIVPRGMIMNQQMRWHRWTVQSFLDVRVAVLNEILEGVFRRSYPDFCPSIALSEPQPQRDSAILRTLSWHFWASVTLRIASSGW